MGVKGIIIVLFVATIPIVSITPSMDTSSSASFNTADYAGHSDFPCFSGFPEFPGSPKSPEFPPTPQFQEYFHELDRVEIKPPVSTLQNDELDQSQTQYSTSAILCGRWMWAQSFVPTLAKLTRVKLLIGKRGEVENITVSIRKYLYGPDLTFVTKTPSQIPENAQWVEFDFDDINVFPDETYYIVFSTTGGDNRENYYYILCSNKDVYYYGDALIGWKYGWFYYWNFWEPPFDFCFKTYGIETEYHENETAEKWTFMLYDDADFENAYDPLDHFAMEGWSGNGLNAVVLQDRNDGPAKIWYIDKYHRKSVVDEWGEVNMGDYKTLRDFINYCKEHFPADKYILDLYNHGGGWLGACIDVTDNDSLSMDEIQRALEEAGGVDVLMFNAPCLMGNFEAVYEVREFVKVYIGSEELSGYKLGVVGAICELLNHNYEPIECTYLGEYIIEQVEEIMHPNYYFTMSAVRTDKIDNLASAIDKLCRDLTMRWLRYYGKVEEAHKNTFRFGMDYADNYQLYDLYDFVENLMDAGVSSPIKEDIINLQTAFNETVIAECHGVLERGAHGLSIYFPDKLMNGLTMAYRMKSYGLDFPRDSFWDEFLAIYVLTSMI